MDEAPSAPSAAPPSSRRWRRTLPGPSQGPLREPHALDQARCSRGFLSVSQRFPEPCSPTVSAARPSQSRLGAHQCWSRGPSRPNEPPHAGGAVHNSSRTGGRSARGGPRVVRCCRRRAVTPPPGSQFVSAVVSPGNRDSKRIPRARRVGNLNVFPSRAALPSLQRSPPLRAWRLPGEAARAAPPQRPPSRGRGSPLAEIRARGVALCRGPTTSWGRPVRRHATSQGHPGRRPMKPACWGAGEAGLIGVLGQASSPAVRRSPGQVRKKGM